MRRRYTRGRQPQKRTDQLVSIAILVFMLSAACTTIGFQHNQLKLASAESGGAVAAQAKQWISKVVSRGGSSRTPVDASLTEKLVGLLENTYPSLGVAEESGGDGGRENISGESGKLVGEAGAKDGDGKTAEEKGDTKSVTGSMDENSAESAQVAEAEKKTEVPVVDTTKGKAPVVLIYHTHASESYQPVTEGNFHSLGEAGTVREVGNVMTQALEAKGIPVLHDMTLHDSPSYNQSYSRSIQTVKNHLAKNPSIKIVIDLHRDAASYAGNKGKTVNINGETVASYSLVIGQDNANLKQLTAFGNEINRTAEKMYPGFGGHIIEKQYRFNQYVSDHALLLEIGNNENTIQQVKATGKYFANVVEAYLKNHS